MIDFKEDEKLSVLNHSCAHVMAQAIKHLYPQAKFWVGPVVSEGFYYDVDLGNDVIKDEDIPKIEKEMKKICKDGKRITRQEISKEEALEMFKDDEYKIEKIDIGIMGEINEESEVKNNKKSKNNVIGIVDSIEKISVDISSKVSKEEKEYVISSKDANTLKEYLSNVYDVNTKNIFIH